MSRGLFAALAALAVGGILIVAGCGGNEENAADGEAAGAVVSVEMGEFFVKPDQMSVAAGAVTFDVTNTGSIEHEFIVYKTDEDPGSLPVEGDRVPEDEALMQGEIGGEDLQPGAGSTLTLTLDAGNYVLFCNLPGHYANGQFIGFTVS